MAKAKKEKMEANPFKLKKELPHLPGYIIVILWTAFIFCMIGWIILASLSTTKEIFTGGLLASGLHFENYTKALFTNKAALNLLNSVIYTVPSCILIIVVCAPAAYCMSRFKFRGAGLIQALIIIGLAIPNIMIVMPLFSVVSALNLSGTHFTLIFLYTACSVPYTTFFLLTFFKGISTSFEEAAAIDGCGPIQCFWKIMFPLAQPAIVTVSMPLILPFISWPMTALPSVTISSPLLRIRSRSTATEFWLIPMVRSSTQRAQKAQQTLPSKAIHLMSVIRRRPFWRLPQTINLRSISKMLPSRTTL